MDEMKDDAFTDTGTSPPPVRGTTKWLFVRSRLDRAFAPTDEFGLIEEGSSTNAFFVQAVGYDEARVLGTRLADKWLREEFGIDLEEASSIQWFDLVIEEARLGHFREPITRIGERVQVIEDGVSGPTGILRKVMSHPEFPALEMGVVVLDRPIKVALESGQSLSVCELFVPVGEGLKVVHTPERRPEAPAESDPTIIAVACAVCRANEIFFFPDKPREAWDATCGEIVELFEEGSCLHPLCGTCSIALGHLSARGHTNITFNELEAAGKRFNAAGCYDAEDLVRFVEEARR